MRAPFLIALTFALATSFPLHAADPAPAAESTVAIVGAVEHPLTLTHADLAKLPHIMVDVADHHTGKKEQFSGVLLSVILEKAGATLGEHLRGKALATYVVAEASDGYRVVYSLAELDPGLSEGQVLLVDTMDGKPLDEKDGPFRLVAPNEKRPARWVRMVNKLTVVKAP